MRLTNNAINDTQINTLWNYIWQLWNVKTDSKCILYTYTLRLHSNYTCELLTTGKCIVHTIMSARGVYRCHDMTNSYNGEFYLYGLSHTIIYCASLISSTAYSFRVGIWPPSQRAPAPAIVLTDKSTHHEPEEWGRGGTTAYRPPGFRWVVLSSH